MNPYDLLVEIENRLTEIGLSQILPPSHRASLRGRMLRNLNDGFCVMITYQDHPDHQTVDLITLPKPHEPH